MSEDRDPAQVAPQDESIGEPTMEEVLAAFRRAAKAGQIVKPFDDADPQ